MKKIIFALVALTLLACERQPKTFILEPSTVVKILPDLTGWALSRSDSDTIAASDSSFVHLSPLEIVKETIGLSFQNPGLFGGAPTNRGFNSWQRDTLAEPPFLKMFATDIINDSGLVPDFIESEDIIFFRVVNDQIDTVAYIPNAVIRAAEVAVKAAFEAQNYDSVYTLFNEAFTFLPVTGPEWRAIKAAEAD